MTEYLDNGCRLGWLLDPRTHQVEIYRPSGYPRKAGHFGVGHVLYGTKSNHEFSHPAEDRPT
jgi:hypothetical protein